MNEDRNTISIGGALQTMDASLDIVPGLAACELMRVWEGWRPVSTDLMPVIGRYGSPRVILAMAFGGLGFTLGLVASRAIKDLVLEGIEDPLIRAFSPQRSDLGFHQ